MRLSQIAYAALFGVLLLIAVYLFLVTTVGTNARWGYEVVHEDLEDVSGLVLHDGVLYVTLEGRRETGKLLSIDEGNRRVLVDHLSKPDGLAFFAGALIFTQEAGVHDVFERRDRVNEPLFRAISAEGVDVGPDGNVYVIEDRSGGRLLKYERATGEVTTLVAGLDQGEGVCVMSDGTIYYTEKVTGIVYRWREGSVDEFMAGLHAPGYLNCERPADGIWITEDRTRQGRLMHVAPDGRVEVIGERLWSPQSVVLGDDDRILVAEQGRNRILRFSRGGDGGFLSFVDF